MNAYKNINSEGANTDSEGNFTHSVTTPCAKLNAAFSFNRRGLRWVFMTARRCRGSDTRGERGV